MCLHFLSSARDQSIISSVQWDIFKKIMFNTSTSQKSENNLSKHIITFFSGLTPVEIHRPNHAYNLVGVYFKKTDYKHRWKKSYFTQQQRATMTLYLNIKSKGPSTQQSIQIN
jgi:hypothetical protein